MATRSTTHQLALRPIFREPYICPACLLKRTGEQRAFSTRTLFPYGSLQLFGEARTAKRLKRNTVQAGVYNNTTRIRPVRTSKRSASNGSLASSTAINAPSTVPLAYRDLLQALLSLEHSASTYVDLARLQLAARSLESSNPVVRVALLGLGLNGANAARKLARVVLADALGQEDTWERALLERSRDGESLLLRYGDSEDVAQSASPVQIMHIPSPLLQRNNLEILITTLNANGAMGRNMDRRGLEEAVLVPPLTTPNSAGGRVGFVRYPVHKALIVAEGIGGAVHFGRLPASIVDGDLVNAALSVPLRSPIAAETAEETVSDNAVDIDLASHALNLFRSNKANGVQFSKEWQTSRTPRLSEWLSTCAHATRNSMNSALRGLITSLLSDTSNAIIHSEAEQRSEAANVTVPDFKRAELQSNISTWSQEAHQDLQMNLNAALLSRTWRRTAWWRLFWRIDDVTVSAGDILRLSWLTEGEQGLAFLSGKIHEAGLATLDELKEARAGAKQFLSGAVSQDDRQHSLQQQNVEPEKAQVTTPADLFQTPTLLSRVQQRSGINAVFDPPWPQTIHLSRQQMLHTLVPSMHAKAQALLLTTLTTIGGTAALGAWIYIATAGFAVYEAGTVAALGLVWSVRRLQSLWGRERDSFATTLREDGRRVLAEVESHLRRIVKEGGRATVRPEDRKSWQEASAGVQLCRRALERIK